MCFLDPGLHSGGSGLFSAVRVAPVSVSSRHPPWHNAAMARFDKYDVIGLILLGLIAALWIAHIVLPTPPPLPDLP
jgi:hypothetical protein